MDEDAATRKQGRPSERRSGIHAATTLPPAKKQQVRMHDEEEDGMQVGDDKKEEQEEEAEDSKDRDFIVSDRLGTRTKAAMTLVTSAPSGPRARLAGVNVRSILCRKYAVAFDGTDQPHYKTSFMEGGVYKTEWLEAGELPVKKLADFEVALDSKRRRRRRPRSGPPRGPGSLAPGDLLPLLLTSPSVTMTTMTTVRRAVWTRTTGTASPTETRTKRSALSESDMT
jgi:hypothetical protein